MESARLPEMTDFLTLDEGHAFIMFDAEVIRQVKHFLDHASFSK